MKNQTEEIAMLLSTSDNPYNPFGQFDEWYAYDEDHGYHTCQYVARLIFSGDALSDAENQRAINEAVRKIYQVNPKGLYVIYYSDGRVEKFDNELYKSMTST